MPLPGFGGGRGKPSTTEKVRLRGLVERTRVTVVEVAGRETSLMEEGNRIQTDDESTVTDGTVEEFDEDVSMGEDHERWEMEVARIYEKTIVELGLSLDLGAREFG